MGLKHISHYLAIALEKMPTTRYQPTFCGIGFGTAPCPCRHCTHWRRKDNDVDCANGLLMRQPTCRGYERDPGSDDDVGYDDDHRGS